MTTANRKYHARAGDVVAVHGHHLGESGRLGEVVEVIGDPDRPRLRVRWEDGRETILSPSSDAVIERRRRRRKKPAPAA